MEEGGKLIVFIGVVLLIALLMAYPTMWLWNWLMPKIFGLIEISFWQALGLNILSRIFFKNASHNSSKS